ncbi:CopG family transcriptional regulator [Streptomyces sp. NPDC017095]|uniref:CopG family transcriptional regulator n=1 Tax=Streptomyces sp. NPDC017095 TaxID=3364977 RepID=UPI0037A1172F
MSLKRTNVYADPEDLAIIKEAAKRRGISEAEIIRQGIHLTAMAHRVWDEPLFSRTFEGPGRTASKAEVRDVRAARPLGRPKASRVLPDDLPL